MKCEDLLKALNDYVDGDVDPAICDNFEEHLEGCNPCEVVVDNIRGTIKLFKAGEEYPLPEEFKQRLHCTLRERFRAKFACPEKG